MKKIPGVSIKGLLKNRGISAPTIWNILSTLLGKMRKKLINLSM